MSASSGRSSRYFAPSEPSRPAPPTTLPRRLKPLAIAVAVAALIGTSCERIPYPRPTPPDPLQQIREALSTRAEAAESGDAAAFLAPLAPEAKAIEQPMAQSLVTLPIEEISFSLRGRVTATATGAEDLNVDLNYSYEGLPEGNRFRIPIEYDVSIQGSRVRFTSSAIDADERPIWMTGPVEVTRSARFLALYRPGIPNPAATLSLAEQARDRLAQKVTFPLEEGYLVMLARDNAEYALLTTTPATAQAIAQAETTFEITEDSIEVRGRHIVVNLQRLYSEGDAIETLQHELAHLALGSETRPFTPAWVSEAAAMYLAGTRPVPTWRLGQRQRRFDSISFADLNRAATLGAHDPTGDAAGFEYAYSAAAAYFLIERSGVDLFWEFYRSYAQVPAAQVYPRIPSDPQARASELARMSEELTHEALQRIYGLTTQELDRQVRAFIRRQV